MQEILMFVMAGCPHCRLAHKLMDELLEEHPGWKDIPVRVVDERREAALADSYDYYYVPSYYVNGKKVHEGHAEKADVEAVYRAALGETAGV
ncbi:thioredoxin family protein [Lawsonibacter sp. NSJ-52]|uniref:Thioredoxin family protein n=2 Tax=Lawsonibacter faecis TaxID=2763052 RepID=A0A8J6MCQ5_9FIRM|nr:thioredoxin family protein [Lawsonibacter faecis]